MISDLIFITSLITFSFFLKKYFNFLWPLPTAMIAGPLGLLLSSGLLNIYTLKLSSLTYLDWFLAIIFVTFPLTSSKHTNYSFQKLKNFWIFSLLQYLIQWGLSTFLVVILLKNFFSNINDSFSVILPSGLAGGHGTAAVIGGIFAQNGQDEILTLAMTMATLGAFTALIGGVLIILYGVKKGLIKSFNYNSIGHTSINLKGIVLPALFLFSLCGISFFVHQYSIKLLKLNFPLFVTAIWFGFFARLVLKDKINPYKLSLNKVSNYATDLLVIVGILTIKFSILNEFFIPFLLLYLFGVGLGLFNFFFLRPRLLANDSFEKGLFTWGWSVGGLVFGLALVKTITDESAYLKHFSQFAIVYLLLAPFEVALILLMPILILKGVALITSIMLFLLAIALIKLAWQKTDK
jgi:ESS family glutamate:Na+ symporter